jgi:hypothetical protein
MSRPELGRDESYNRIRIPSDLKSQICSQIADSSESLPLTSVSEDSVSDAQSKPTTTTSNLQPPTTDSTDLATPTPEKPNPLEQVKTERDTPNITPTQTNAQGSTLGASSTAEDGSSRPKMPGRPSTMKRIGTALKKSISSNKQ